MKIDPADMFATGFGWATRQSFLYFVAIWIGCFISAVSLLAGVFIDGKGIPAWRATEWLWMSPLLLGSYWFVPNIAILGFGAIYFFRSDNFGLRGWGIFAGMESLIAMFGWVSDFEGWGAVASAWGTWLVITIMFATALWFIHQWQRNKWAGEIAMLHAENAMRKAELRARGIATFDRDPD